MSFGFRTLEDTWPAADRRELRAVDLIEITLVSAFPAYSQTEVSARTRETARNGAAARIRALRIASL
jgi:phage head maturation protease